ncbi:phosphatidylinositol transfer protein beta isoform-like [Styela clava]|uniref:phosphatidylinositol transfer protein beta isoform-like n=1 Tax=Styela clava TaxID=7725 RepID=UPI001939BF41|nr:phosphatidylinositol transfer protein beta isoform-like [Styela clava]
MIIKEFRIILPMTVEEYQVGQLWSVAEASKNETGGGEGVDVLENRPYTEGDTSGQFTHKVFHLASRVPSFLRHIAPKGSLEFHEKAWNAYPYCKTVITNPDYMKKDFELSIESWHKPDFGDEENVHGLPPNLLAKREVIRIDIANDEVNSSDYKEDQDPKLFKPSADGRGPLTSDWIQRLKSQENGQQRMDSSSCKMPHMCAYKLVRCNFKWFGLQNMVEKFVHRQERRVFTNFHRQVYCWMNNWLTLTMEDIRRIEDETQKDLKEMRSKGSIKGTKVNE